MCMCVCVRACVCVRGKMGADEFAREAPQDIMVPCSNSRWLSGEPQSHTHGFMASPDHGFMDVEL